MAHHRANRFWLAFLWLDGGERPVAKRTITEGYALKKKNRSDPHDDSVWFGHKCLADGQSGHRPSPDGTTNVKNGQEIKTRLFEA